MKYQFDNCPDRQQNESVKWLLFDRDVLPMWVADMDFRSPPAIIEALQARAAHGVYGYPKEPQGLRESILAHLERRYGWRVAVEDLVPVPGVIKGLTIAVEELTTQQDGLLIQTPIYPPILHMAELQGRISQSMQLARGPDGQYTVDMEAFEAACDERTRMFILCNPHNPTGRVYTPEELSQMAEICLRRDLVIVSDEIHSDLTFPDHPHTPIASLDPEIAQRTITLMAPSKTFNIPGLKASFAVIQNPELRQQFNHGMHRLHEWVNLFGQVGMEAAYRAGYDWLLELMDYLDDNRRYLLETLQHSMPQLSMAAPQGTYLGWIDCRQADIEGNVQKFFIEHGQVAFNDGADFGPGGEDFVRLNFACPRCYLEDGLERMQEALATLH